MKVDVSGYKSKFIECDCYSSDHIFKFSYFEDEPEIYLTVHLSSHRGFFGRLKRAFKYLMGYKCRYGNWDEVVMDKDKAQDLAKFLLDNVKRIEQLEKVNL